MELFREHIVVGLKLRVIGNFNGHGFAVGSTVQVVQRPDWWIGIRCRGFNKNSGAPSEYWLSIKDVEPLKVNSIRYKKRREVKPVVDWKSLGVDFL